MNVLSLFDGMSCGRLALERAGIKVDNYFASEVDKYAIKVAQALYPDTVHIGDVRNVKACDLPHIDLLIGGSPCQGFSQAGKGGKFDDPRSKLFWEYKRLLDELQPKYFLLENVSMDKFSEGVISDALGIDPVVINSALVSAQNRVRLYWSNIRTAEHTMFGHLKTDIPQPEDKGILLKDILERDESQDHILSDKAMERIARKLYSTPQFMPDKTGTLNTKNNSGQLSMDSGTTLVPVGCIQIGQADLNGHDSIKRVYSPDGKGPTLTTMEGGHREPKVGIKNICNLNGKDQQGNHIVGTDGKCPTLLSQSGGTAGAGNHLISDPPYTHWRKLTPRECGRLQTVPEWAIDRMLDTVSNSQAYKMLGNGWTVEVIAHIFSFLKEEK